MPLDCDRDRPGSGLYWSDQATLPLREQLERLKAELRRLRPFMEEAVALAAGEQLHGLERAINRLRGIAEQ